MFFLVFKEGREFKSELTPLSCAKRICVIILQLYYELYGKGEHREGNLHEPGKLFNGVPMRYEGLGLIYTQVILST